MPRSVHETPDRLPVCGSSARGSAGLPIQLTNDRCAPTSVSLLLSDLHHVSSLRSSACTRDDLKFDLIAVFKTLVALRSNGAVMNENILAIRSADEAVSFGVIEEFDRSLQTLSIHTFFLRWSPSTRCSPVSYTHLTLPTKRRV